MFMAWICHACGFKLLVLQADQKPRPQDDGSPARPTRLQKRNKMAKPTVVSREDLAADLQRLLQAKKNRAEEEADVPLYAMLLRRCGRLKELEEGKRLHTHIATSRFSAGDATLLGNLVVQMYGACGCVGDARRAFDAIAAPNIFSWNIMLSAYAHNGHFGEAVKLFDKMAAPPPNRVSFVTVLKACAAMRALHEGRLIHARVVASGLLQRQGSLILSTALLNLYGRCGSVDEARLVFDSMPRRDTVAWNAMIAGYAQNGHTKKAIQLYESMSRVPYLRPDSATMVAVIHACSSLHEGARLHGDAVNLGVDASVMVSTAIVAMYSRCGCIESARWVFNQMRCRNLVTWTTMIEAYAQSGQSLEAVELFKMMLHQGLKVDKVVVTIVLNACSDAMALAEGRRVHLLVLAMEREEGFEVDRLVADAIVQLYVNCGQPDEAATFALSRHEEDSLIFWNALITAFSRAGHNREAIRLWREMASRGVEPNIGTFEAVLGACKSSSFLKEVVIIHSWSTARGLDSEVLVATALVNAYSACGCIDRARAVFDQARRSNVVLWTAMISAYAQMDDTAEVLELWRVMYQQGLKPNKITMSAVIGVAVEAGQPWWWVFVTILQDHGMTPTYDHYASLVHVLSLQLGLLEEAKEVIENMPFEPEGTVWMTLFRGCCKAKRQEEVNKIRTEAADNMLKLAKEYAEMGKWSQVEVLRKTIQDSVVVTMEDQRLKLNKQADLSSGPEPVLRSPAVHSKLVVASQR